MSDPASVQLLVLDVDGVLTDGTLHYADNSGEVGRVFHIHDGVGMRVAREAGLKVGILTAKVASSTQQRIEHLGVDVFLEGYDNKAAGIEEMAARSGVALEHMAYAGDDLLDLPALNRVGYPMTVANGCAECKTIAKFVTEKSGGRGAVREIVEHLLKAQGKWTDAVARFEK